MALIPLTYKLDWYDPSQPGGSISTINDNANLATSSDTQYTMQDVIDTVIAGGSTPGINDRIPVYQETSPGQFTLAPSAASITYPSVPGANYMILRDAYSMVLSREAQSASGDPEYVIVDENFNYKISMGWDDDGGDFGYLYAWNGGDWRIGSSTLNPTLTVKSSEADGGIIVDGGVEITNSITTDTALRWTHPAGGASDEVYAYFSGAVAGSRFVISREATGGAEIELESDGDINLNRTGNGGVLIGGLGNYADDAAAAAGGVPINGLYRNGNNIQIRIV